MDIRELRLLSGLTQKAFAQRFDIPVGTLRRWEYGESTPAPYIVKLIALQLPTDRDNLTRIGNKNGNTIYYNSHAGYLEDSRGTRIRTGEIPDGVKAPNLLLYASDLFDAYYEIVEKFDRDCRFDKTEDIIWS